MASHYSYVISLGNSIVGVGVLALPFTFQQCGLLLGILLLLGSAWLTQVSCWLLVRAAVGSKKLSYEYLAYHVFGYCGKFLVEICIIGQLIGTCIAFHVVIGDLGPAIISKLFGIENSGSLRVFIMCFLAMTVALPLALLRNIESLSGFSLASILFYFYLTLHLFTYTVGRLFSGEWLVSGQLWRIDGMFRCLAIFCLGFGCQTQLFVMYDAVPEPSVSLMNRLSKEAISLCTFIYLSVGFLGYVCYNGSVIQGDVLLHFPDTMLGEVVKLMFVVSVAMSFPLCIFPCRAAIFTLLNGKAHGQQSDIGGVYIPHTEHQAITFGIVSVTLLIGILIPNVEFVLGLTGAIAGSLICYIFPAVIFLRVLGNSGVAGKGKAYVVLVLGILILVASTFSTLSAQEKALESRQEMKEEMTEKPIIPDIPQNIPDPVNDKVQVNVDTQNSDEEKRHEPPNPVDPKVDEKIQESINEEENRELGGQDVKQAIHEGKDSKLGQPLELKKEADESKVLDKPVNDKDKLDDTNVKEGADEKKLDLSAKEESLKEKEEQADKLIHKLKEHEERQLDILNKQQKLLDDLRQHKEDELVEEAKEKAEHRETDKHRDGVQENVAGARDAAPRAGHRDLEHGAAVRAEERGIEGAPDHIEVRDAREEAEVGARKGLDDRDAEKRVVRNAPKNSVNKSVHHMDKHPPDVKIEANHKKEPEVLAGDMNNNNRRQDKQLNDADHEINEKFDAINGKVRSPRSDLKVTTKTLPPDIKDKVNPTPKDPNKELNGHDLR